MLFKNYNPKNRDFEIMRLLNAGFTMSAVARFFEIDRARIRIIKMKMIHLEKQGWNNIPTRLNYNGYE